MSYLTAAIALHLLHVVSQTGMLVVADDSDGVSAWDFDAGRCLGAFQNCNAAGTAGALL